MVSSFTFRRSFLLELLQGYQRDYVHQYSAIFSRLFAIFLYLSKFISGIKHGVHLDVKPRLASLLHAKELVFDKQLRAFNTL